MALTGRSRPSSDGVGIRSATETAATAGLLDDEAFFWHSFNELVGGEWGEKGIPHGFVAGDDDGPDARILEQVRVWLWLILRFIRGILFKHHWQNFIVRDIFRGIGMGDLLMMRGT